MGVATLCLCPAPLPYLVGESTFIDDFLELDSVDLSDPEDFEEALREGWEPRLWVGVAEFRPSAAAASADNAEFR